MSLNAQQQEPQLTLSYENASFGSIIEKIEQISDYRFFFVENWLGSKKYTNTFDKVGIKEILDTIIAKTDLNYYIIDRTNIVLLQNRVIYNQLPDGFFGKEKTASTITVDRENLPVLGGKEKSVKKARVEHVSIGKANLNDERKTFTLKGYVKSRNAMEPLANATLIETNRKTGTTSNNLGYYEIKLKKGLNTIEASSLGFESLIKRVTIYNDGILDFLLRESVEELDEVVVEGNQDVNIKEASTGTNEVDSEETKNIPLVLGERNILKVATTLPGITTAGEGAAGFNVRGGKTDQNLILLDKAVIYNPSHFFGIFQALNPFTTQSIKVYKGSVPAEYGGRLSSVFDIRSKDGSVDEFKGEASIGPVTNNIAIEMPVVKGKSSFMVGGRISYSDWILKSLDDEKLNKSTANFYDFVAKYNDSINENNDIKATIYYSKDVFSITSDSLYSYNNRLFSLDWNHKFNEKNIGNLSLSHSGYGFNIDYDGNSNTDFEFGYGIKETGAKLKLSYLRNKKLKFDYGASAKLYNVIPGNMDPKGEESKVAAVHLPNEKGVEAALFLSNDIDINDNLSFNAGLRYSIFRALGKSTARVYDENSPKNEDTVRDTLFFENNENEKTYGGLETRLSARYLLTNNLSIKASYNSMYQYIHTLSNNTTASPIDTWKLSDYNIKPQFGQQVSLGLYKNIEGNDYEISLEGYYKASQGVPDFKTGAQLTMNENIETEVLQGNGKAYGIEFLVKKNRGDLNGWLGYTYSRSFLKMDSEFSEERINNGEYFPSNYDKPHDFNIIANYKATRRFSFSANFVYQTGRPITYPIGNFTYNGETFSVYSDRNKFRIPDYYRLDLSFNVEGNHKLKKPGHGYWNLSIYNVLGRNNPYSVFFVTEDGEVKAYKSSIFSIPIPTISYNIKF